MRPARADEVPGFGDVWQWDDAGPMMAIGPVDSQTATAGAGQWWFIWVDGVPSGEPAATIAMWVGYNDGGEWVVLDE